MYFYVATVQKSCPPFKMNCFEVPEIHLTSPLFFCITFYLHPGANIGVDSCNMFLSRVLFVFWDEPYISPTFAPTNNHSSDSSKSKKIIWKSQKQRLKSFPGWQEHFFEWCYLERCHNTQETQTSNKNAYIWYWWYWPRAITFWWWFRFFLTDKENNIQGSWFT